MFRNYFPSHLLYTKIFTYYKYILIFNIFYSSFLGNISFKILSILAPYSIDSSSSNINSGVFLKFTLLANSDLIYPDDFLSPAKVSFTFFELSIDTATFAYFKSLVVLTLVTLINPVTDGFFNS